MNIPILISVTCPLFHRNPVQDIKYCSKYGSVFVFGCFHTSHVQCGLNPYVIVPELYFISWTKQGWVKCSCKSHHVSIFQQTQTTFYIVSGLVLWSTRHRLISASEFCHAFLYATHINDLPMLVMRSVTQKGRFNGFLLFLIEINKQWFNV